MTTDEKIDLIMSMMREIKQDVSNIKLTIENDLVPTNNLTLEMLVDHSKRFIKLEKELQVISDNAIINDVLEEIKSMKTI